MPRTVDWRSQDAGDALKELDRAGLAWKFLRRNPEYREDYRRALDRIAAGAITEESAMAARVRLAFRPTTRLKIYLYGYIIQIQLSQRLEPRNGRQDA